jgi:hypothetical protein
MDMDIRRAGMDPWPITDVIPAVAVHVAAATNTNADANGVAAAAIVVRWSSVIGWSVNTMSDDCRLHILATQMVTVTQDMDIIHRDRTLDTEA